VIVDDDVDEAALARVLGVLETAMIPFRAAFGCGLRPARRHAQRI
jgi:hypothetical protein